jgi:polyketide biosynthesis enoyl-CoA hydratase PksI
MTQAVVTLEEVEPGIALIRMQDREHRNTFSAALMEGLAQAFRQLEADTRYRAVILTGYDSYFASGGTQEGLLAIQQGQARFTDMNLYSLPLECPLPVISAMQGHGIGGGFVLGLFADIVILGRECVYTTNFMKYGFTPGMGATLIVPDKLGRDVGADMLLTARSWRGEELKERGVGCAVLPRAEVLPRAMELARELAAKPRLSLVTLKRHLGASLRERLPAIVEQELAMHAITFHQPEVRERISALFGR